ncbi:MAG TPA: hypothetical protein VGI12_11255 [Vicinamibacterales bacterium]|jgi:hypothetical protein
MTGKTFVVVVLLAALVAAGVVAMHGKGHAALARWLPAIHGGPAH